MAQSATSLAKDRVVALGQGHDEVVGVDHAGGGLHLLARRFRWVARTAVADVLRDGAREQERLLEHDPDARPQVLAGEFPDVPTVDEDPPFCGVVEARYQAR